MEKRIKGNQGFALTGVIVLIAVMTFLGTSMYAYSMQALKTLEYGTDRQKASYLARSGIEASVYMYQDILLRAGTENDSKGAKQQLAEFISESTNDGDTATNEEITTNWIIMLDTRKNILGKKQIEYVDGGNGEEPDYSKCGDESYVGAFKVFITNDHQQITDDIAGVTRDQYIKRFRSIARVGHRQATKHAYIVPVVDISSKNWIDKDGTIRIFNCESDETSIIYKSTVTIDCGVIDKLASWFADKFHIGSSGKRLDNVEYVVGCTTGNMIISNPAESDTIKFEYIGDGEIDKKKDNIAGFAAMGNLFIEPGIDMKPDKSRFNILFLRGNQIVIDNPIELYVYDPGINYSKDEADSNFIANILHKTTAIVAKISKNYRLGTVVIGTSSKDMSTVNDPKPKADGGLGECGKVFFGGDVYINFMSSQGTKKYKVFSAGDIFYFDGDYIVNDKEYGIDLVKYFLDTAKEHGYSGTVLQQFTRTRDFYYDSVGSKYPEKAMREIQVGKNTYDKVSDTIIPSSGDTAYIIWEGARQNETQGS